MEINEVAAGTQKNSRREIEAINILSQLDESISCLEEGEKQRAKKRF
jgi:hypothetical protein